MKPDKNNEKLKKEKEKLDRLVDIALESGTPLAQDETVIAQNCKVDELVARLQRKKEHYREKRKER